MATNGNGNPFGDTSYVSGENAVMVLPPVIQWHRGDLTNANPALKNGCWQVTQEQAGAILGDTAPVADVLHSGGVVVPSYIFPQIHVLVLAHRKRWFYRDGEKTIWLAPGAEFPKGAKSKVQVYVICKELNGEPALLTASSLNAMHLERAMNDFVKKVITPASRMSKAPFGRHHFWLPLASAGKWTNEVLKQNGQYITPPVLGLPEQVTVDVMKSLLAGREDVVFAESVIPEAREWAKGVADTQPQERMPDYSDAPDPDETYAPVAAADDIDEIPF